MLGVRFNDYIILHHTWNKGHAKGCLEHLCFIQLPSFGKRGAIESQLASVAGSCVVESNNHLIAITQS